jgi:trk system potassium uptake protein TrkA
MAIKTETLNKIEAQPRRRPISYTASTILRYVRRGDILSLTAVAGDKAEVIEARVNIASPLAGRKLRDARLPKAALIGTIIRGDDLFVPTGDDDIRPGDRLIIFTLRESVRDMEKLLG